MYRKIDFFETKGEVSKKKVAEVIDILRSDMRDKPLDINRLFPAGCDAGDRVARRVSSAHHPWRRRLKSFPQGQGSRPAGSSRVQNHQMTTRGHRVYSG
jgi:hypothetical protein